MQSKNINVKTILTREEMLKKVNPSQHWDGFDNFRYECKKFSELEALRTLRTCWKSRATFIEIAQRYLYEPEKEYQYETKEDIDARMEKVKQMAETFDNKNPLQIPAFLHRDLIIQWPEAYPPNSGIPDSAIIVEDGNKRLSALTIRYLQKKDIIYNEVEVFIGTLH